MTCPTESPGWRWTPLGPVGYSPGGRGVSREAEKNMSFLDYYLIVLFVALVALLVYKFKN